MHKQARSKRQVAHARAAAERRHALPTESPLSGVQPPTRQRATGEKVTSGKCVLLTVVIL
jgi:hypothetical protein